MLTYSIFCHAFNLQSWEVYTRTTYFTERVACLLCNSKTVIFKNSSVEKGSFSNNRMLIRLFSWEEREFWPQIVLYKTNLKLGGGWRSIPQVPQVWFYGQLLLLLLSFRTNYVPDGTKGRENKLRTRIFNRYLSWPWPLTNNLRSQWRSILLRLQ